MIQHELNNYSTQLPVNEQKLTSKDLGYHKYFALVYKI